MGSAEELMDAGRAAAEAGRYGEAIARFDEVIAASAERSWVALALERKAYSLRRAGFPAESIAVADEVIARFGDDRDDYLEGLVSLALDGKAKALRGVGRHEEELAVRELQLGRYARAESVGRPWARLDALGERGRALDALGRYGEAAVDWTEVLSAVDGASDPQARRRAARALVGRARAQRHAGNYDAALVDVERVQGEFSREEGPGITVLLADALWQQIWAWREIGAQELAAAGLERLTTDFAGETDPWIVDVITRALQVRGDDSYARREYEAAEAFYDKVVERGRDTTSEFVWAHVVEAAAGKALVLSARRQDDAALAYLDLWLKQTAERFPGRPGLFGRLLVTRIALLVNDARWVDVLLFANEVIDRFADDNDGGLRGAVARALIEKASAIAQLGRPPDERLAAYEAIADRAEDCLAVLDWQLATFKEPAEWVAQQSLVRASLLSELDRDDESAHALDELIHQFESSSNPALQMFVAAAREARADLDTGE